MKCDYVGACFSIEFYDWGNVLKKKIESFECMRAACECGGDIVYKHQFVELNCQTVVTLAKLPAVAAHKTK